MRHDRDEEMSGTSTAATEREPTAPRWLHLARRAVAAGALAGIAFTMWNARAPSLADPYCSEVSVPFEAGFDASRSNANLALRLARAGERIRDNEFCVIQDGLSIGRIRLTTLRGAAKPVWDWNILTPEETPSWGRGSAPSLGEAKVAFDAVWERFYAGLTPAEIAHWHRQQDEERAAHQHGN
jgi:hypothetical protein